VIFRPCYKRVKPLAGLGSLEPSANRPTYGFLDHAVTWYRFTAPNCTGGVVVVVESWFLAAEPTGFVPEGYLTHIWSRRGASPDAGANW
jgi:hypothetical protein